MSSELLNKLIDFVQKYLHYTDRDLIKDYILQHQKYGTCDYAIDDKGEIIAIARWNLSHSGTVAHLLDFAVRPDFRKSGVGRDMLVKGLKRFNRVKWLIYDRGQKYPDREQKYFAMEEILKRRLI